MAVTDDTDTETTTPPRFAVPARPRFETPVVPRNSIAGRALIAVVAIMTFLASLTTGAVILVGQAAGEWQADVAREVTIQVVPAPGRDTDATVTKAAAIARAFPGVGDVRVFSKEESSKLLEPWLGSGLSLGDLPVPRLIVVRLASGETVDMARLNRLLIDQAPGATLDDHRGWIERMRAMAGSVVAGGIVILVLMLAATVLSVTFATRGAMATNRNVIEVLHLVGAKNNFIAGNFQRHFLVMGLQGGLIGGGAAVLLFALAALIGHFTAGTAGGDQSAALFGSFSLGFLGYLAVLAQIVLSAVVTALTSRHTVNRTLEAID
ncbi:ABC transporter permease [Pseudolabrys sp. FHR47]|uniref:cell division protein FtsX n=1 Tax=Pseudolabrys sp. FHR47 TaxID=2562284 RepID=UPI0010BF0832|nr:ABC transporter permease [Pseudolabrys sp. FHR47]